MLGVADFLVRNQKFLHDKRSGRRFFFSREKKVCNFPQRKKSHACFRSSGISLFETVWRQHLSGMVFFFKRAPVFVWEIAFNCPSLSKNGLLAALIVLSSPFSGNETKRQKAFRFFFGSAPLNGSAAGFRFPEKKKKEEKVDYST